MRDQLLEDPELVTAFTRRALDGMSPDARLVLVVDQLEEAFTVCNDEAVRDRFLEVLVHTARDPDAGTTVVAAIRADYYGRCAAHSELAALLTGTNLLVGPLRPDELQRGWRNRHRRAGLVLEEGLVEQIFDDVGAEPGACRSWKPHSSRRGFAGAGTDSPGGLRLVGRRARRGGELADDVYERLSESEQRIAHGLLLRLAEPGMGTDDVRRRAPLEELVVDEDHVRVLASLGRESPRRLGRHHRGGRTRSVAPRVAETPRLVGDGREGRRVQHALSSAAQDWAARHT